MRVPLVLSVFFTADIAAYKYRALENGPKTPMKVKHRTHKELTVALELEM